MNLELLPKVGPKTINILNRININTVEDLLTYYPYRYNIIKFINIEDADDTMTYYIKAKILSVPKVSYIKRNFNKLDFFATNNDHEFKVTIFNRSFLKRNLTVDKEIVIIGKYSKIKNVFTANDIKFNVDEERIEPIYHLTEGIKNSGLENIINSALSTKISLSDNIPNYLNEKYKLLTKNDAIRKIHQPKTINDIKQSELKLIYEELFTYMFKINYLKGINKISKGLPKEFNDNDIQDFLSSLNFLLTKDQLSTIEDILKDMKKLEERKKVLEFEVERCTELRSMLYSDMKEGVISKSDYIELHAAYENKRKDAQIAIHKIELEMESILEKNNDSFKWLEYFKENRNIKELTRSIAVSLIREIKVYDKKNIEVTFDFDNPYKTCLKNIENMGYKIDVDLSGKLNIEKEAV